MWWGGFHKYNKLYSYYIFIIIDNSPLTIYANNLRAATVPLLYPFTTINLISTLHGLSRSLWFLHTSGFVFDFAAECTRFSCCHLATTDFFTTVRGFYTFSFTERLGHYTLPVYFLLKSHYEVYLNPKCGVDLFLFYSPSSFTRLIRDIPLMRGRKSLRYIYFIV